MWHRVRLIKEGECVDLCLDTIHLFKRYLLDLRALLSHSLFFFFRLELLSFVIVLEH